MVLSKFCVLHKASGRELQEQNECIYDQGGCVDWVGLDGWVGGIGLGWVGLVGDWVGLNEWVGCWVGGWDWVGWMIGWVGGWGWVGLGWMDGWVAGWVGGWVGG